MVAGCGNKILKYILLFLNSVIFVLSLAGVIGSLVFIFRDGALEKASAKISELKDISDILSPASIRMGLYILLAASVLILIISFLGCCGAWKEIKWLLGLYAIILFIIVAIEVAAFVVAIVKEKEVENEAKAKLTEAREAKPIVYGDLEKLLNCCGVENGEACVNTTSTTAPVIGCYNKIIELFKENYPIVLAVSIITVIIEVLLIIFSCCLCSNIGKDIDLK